ncbi:MAG TPA: MobQ family relaxase [Steroidobacteraceae bacterium]|nr:MobQ family relaxase [Steroidobacteraceae bacterium]
MAIFHLDIKPVTRSTGRSATSAAAYRAGESIRDERTGTLYNHSERRDVLHKEIILPARLDRPDAGMEWARDRSTLWNAAEKAEKQSTSRVAREYLAALPAELSPERRIRLARDFSREIADRYNVAVDLAVHEPRPQGDPRNYHAHLLATTRQVSPEGLGAKTGLDMSGEVRSELGLPPSRQEFVTLRARWAELTNEALREANIEARVDHRSLEAQGIEREPTPRLPIAALAIERRGQRSEVAERIRERYRARVAAREQRSIGEPQEMKPEETKPEREPAAPLDMEARRRQAVQDWLKYRAGEAQQTGPGGEAAQEAQTGRAGPVSMEELRRRAVEAWKSLRARGAESPRSADRTRDRDAARTRGGAEQPRDAPALGDDYSG